MTNEINKYYKNDIRNIKKFLANRPNVLGCYCYAIGENFSRKIYKLIIICDDIWKWQKLNYKKNESTEYINFLYTSGYNFVEYIGIKENNFIFDYTLINQQEFIDNLTIWKYFTYAEKFQKPFITVKSNNLFDKNIIINQKNALTTSLLMLNNNKTSFFDIMLNIYCISGHLTSEKITLVNENYEMLKYMYTKYDLISCDDREQANIDFNKLKEEIQYLPKKIKNNIYEYKGIPKISGISQYFEQKIINEQDRINDMRYLVNGFFRTFDYNGRIYKTKVLKRDNSKLG